MSANFLTVSDRRYDTLLFKQRYPLHSNFTVFIMTLLFNLWQIFVKAPQIIGIIKAILDLVGSTQVQKILETIRDTLKTEVSNASAPPTTEPERERMVKRLFRRLALNSLGLSEQEYTAFVNQARTTNFV